MTGRVYDPVKTVCQVYSQVGSVKTDRQGA